MEQFFAARVGLFDDLIFVLVARRPSLRRVGPTRRGLSFQFEIAG
jgi:hypothetical protein